MRRALWGLLAVVLVGAGVGVGVLLTRGGSDPAASPSVRPATSGPPTAVQVECANVDRAYNAWSPRAIGAGANAVTMNKVTVKMAMDDGKSFLDQVKGYSDQPALNLVAAIAEYNLNVSIVNAGVTITGEAEQADVDGVVASTAKVETAYDGFKGSTCGGV